MKRSLFLISMCCLLSGCWPEDVSRYGEMILGRWEIKETGIEISGATSESYSLLMEVIQQRFESWEGALFVFKTDNTVVGPESAGTYRLSEGKLRMNLPRSPGEPDKGDVVYNFIIENMGSRSLTMTWDAVWELPLDVIPGVTKCLVTIKATKKNKTKPKPEPEVPE